jgi:hypothetical protein
VNDPTSGRAGVADGLIDWRRSVSTSDAARPRTRRGLLSGGLVVIGAALLVSAAARLLLPSGIEWQLHGYGGPGFDASTAQSTTVVPVYVASWPMEYGADDASWLATPSVTYTPWGVIISLHTSASLRCAGQAARALSPGVSASDCGWYDTGGWVAVHLSEPLAGRALFDGAALPPAARPYP